MALGLATILLLATGAALLASCDLPLSQPTALPGTLTGTPPAPEGSAEAPPTLVPEEATPPPPSVVTLTVWTTELFSPTQSITSGQILAEQIAEFERENPDVRVRFVRKKPYGKGGILDFLQSTAAVVPDLLPDLVLIDVDELDTAVEAGLVQPLDDLISPDLHDDLFLFARDSATFDGSLYGLQVLADLDHLVYNTGRITIPPRSWPGVLSSPGPYLFPAGGQAGLVNDAFLVQYLAARSEPYEEGSDGPFLEEDSLIAVLQFYQDGASRGIFPPEMLNCHTTDDCWPAYVAGQAALAQAGAHRYLSERGGLQGSAAAPVPAANGPEPGIARGWALSLVTPDPARQSVTTEFMTQLMAPEANARWNLAADYLPTRQTALSFWDEADSYTPFIQQQLLQARTRPRLSNYTQVAAALQQAVEGVLTGEATPEEAAAQAMMGVQ
jgi:ABC-type glycerol-3-phosphate transport system substrate-binding protein